MIRFGIVALLIVVPLWAPWMDTKGVENITKEVFEAFGPVASSCYDSEGNLLHEGVEVSWYPLGRLVHTCAGDYVVWVWGAIKEQGGVYKRSNELQAVQSKAITCTDVIERQEQRLASTTDSALSVYTGTYATEPDFAIFKEASEHKRTLSEALKRGPTFAGRFTVAEWGCGSNCQQHAVMDVESGLVVAYGPQTEYGVKYSLDSTLLITNPKDGLPPLPDSDYETENFALSIARVPREYYRLTTDALSGSQYLVRLCVESSATGYIELEDDRLGLVDEE
ncbi:MAG: hypothetical protein UV60_C0002G0033 [Parcubacteria group bacterium GW2011_GWA2_43_11]|nr:MAG: hypothetical protein UU89_C0001G0008 [Parcubacteria group bacterium GW2011_GWC2_42_11]KKS86228.1 MAG: hypothetical protein UV60_C0002G0033 [Parcubacteria group bacterium GW2011_GWA2_43_11]